MSRRDKRKSKKSKPKMDVGRLLWEGYAFGLWAGVGSEVLDPGDKSPERS